MESRTMEEYRDMVNGPGKFEGESIYAPYFYDLLGVSGEDESCKAYGETHYAFFLKTEDIDRFEELTGCSCVHVWEDNNGFFHAEQCTIAEWLDFVEQNEINEE